MISNALNHYKQAIATYLQGNANNVFLFYKGRVALYALLKAYNIQPGDEVILQGFTCVVVPNAILYCGATPVYVDISLNDYNIDVTKIEQAITPRTKIIIAQNTFGLAPNFDAILTIAQKYNLIVLEDCTHGFGGTYNGKKNGTIAHASFFSTQWNKPFSTGVGGFATVNDSTILAKMQLLENQYETPSVKNQLMLRILYFVRQTLLVPQLYWSLVKLYRLLSKLGLVIGSSSAEEIEGTIMPANFTMQLGNAQANKGINELKKLDALNSLRQQNVQHYNTYFAHNNLAQHKFEAYHNNIFLKFPLLVPNREEFLKLAEQYNVQLGEWFNSPLHPVQHNLAAWGYTLGSCPNAEYAAMHIVNLPTELVDVQNVYSLLDTLKTNE